MVEVIVLSRADLYEECGAAGTSRNAKLLRRFYR